jgi:hypothetical protein
MKGCPGSSRGVGSSDLQVRPLQRRPSARTPFEHAARVQAQQICTAEARIRGPGDVLLSQAVLAARARLLDLIARAHDARAWPPARIPHSFRACRLRTPAESLRTYRPRRSNGVPMRMPFARSVAILSAPLQRGVHLLESALGLSSCRPLPKRGSRTLSVGGGCLRPACPEAQWAHSRILRTDREACPEDAGLARVQSALLRPSPPRAC